MRDEGTALVWALLIGVPVLLLITGVLGLLIQDKALCLALAGTIEVVGYIVIARGRSDNP